jgi:disulfide bond formation protein DsbB
MSFRPLALLGGAIMVAAIGLAWAFEVVGGFAPCPLCLEQRVPYYVAIPLAVLALAAAAFAARVPARLLALGAGAAMVWAAGLGIYHAGVEWDLWDGPASCAGAAAGAPTDASSLLAQLEAATFISCEEAAGRFLGLSFAGWNVVSASAAALLLLGAAAAPLRR